MLADSDVWAAIAVKDMAVAEKFYGETLGLKKGKSDPGGTVFMSGNSGIFVYPSQFAGTNQATYAGWSVSDVERTIEELKAKGISFEQYDDLPGVTREGDVHIMGDLKAAWFKDPDGNILNITNM